MTAAASAPVRVPSLGRLWLWTGIAALLSHLALAAYIFGTPPENPSGGGGQVLGTLSIALGGAAVEASPSAQEMPAEPEPLEPAEPTIEPPDAVAEAIPQPQPTPVPAVRRSPKPATAVAPTRKPATQKAVSQTTRTDEKPAQASVRSNATPTLGQGAAAASPGSGGSVDTSAQIYDAYLALLRARIEANRSYPASARRAGSEGVASVRLIIIADGSLRQANIVRSSGHFALDRAAKRMVQKAAPFPAPPGTIFDVTVPVAFALH